ncbi:terminase small subunit [Fimbriiglobus ruber]|uniref:Phage terminase, small subunit n=1 Tax=Fimbriiglobus ruber TaxID=1908690 RepID=A0A225DLV9_9BACT|nr:terminase small subunit [Fimbriiglobus ruber]OWK42450.1 Phage terminase, small subunit [Fimbriiglobus ruber]
MTSDHPTPKQEKFCQKYIELGNASEAYRQAYDAENMSPEAIGVEACRLLQNPKVALRVLELQDEHRQRHNVTVGSLTVELEEARHLALSVNQPAAAVSASLGKAKIHGLIVEKNELTGKGGAPLQPAVIAVTAEAVKDIIQQVRDEF